MGVGGVCSGGPQRKWGNGLRPANAHEERVLGADRPRAGRGAGRRARRHALARRPLPRAAAADGGAQLGTWHAARLAAEEEQVAGTVLLSAPAGTGEEVIEWQIAAIEPTLPRLVRLIMRLTRQDFTRTRHRRVAMLNASAADVIRVSGYRRALRQPVSPEVLALITAWVTGHWGQPARWRPPPARR